MANKKVKEFFHSRGNHFGTRSGIKYSNDKKENKESTNLNKVNNFGTGQYSNELYDLDCSK